MATIWDLPAGVPRPTNPPSATNHSYSFGELYGKGAYALQRPLPAVSPGMPDCSLGELVDVSPMRAPVSVLSALAAIFRARVIAEVGTRNGDGINCFSRVAKRALAIEMDESYCSKLRERRAKLAATGGGSYEVVCTPFQHVPATLLRDIELLHWWVGGNLNAAMFAHVISMHDRGSLRHDVEVVANFDLRWGIDAANWRSLAPMARWHRSVDYDECDACTRRYPMDKQDRFLNCARAVGTIVIAGFRVAQLNLSAVAAATPMGSPPNDYQRSPCPGPTRASKHHNGTRPVGWRGASSRLG